ncbi:MAG: RagB/SusD family nutrient uptake outer membrane protein [Prevotellaceae bacterium]|jgi:hypothetical protein|nr:RagB/SusD family nutrient uptake outer membrane protein [Prevotellaceae bacterium]
MKSHIITALFAAGVGLSACNDDFLQKDPIQDMSENTFLTNESDLAIYLNGLYGKYIEGFQSGWASDSKPPFGLPGSHIITWDVMSDNVVRSGNVDSRLDNSYVVPQSGTSTGWEWNNLRDVNYFLRNYTKAAASVSNPLDLNKWAAEAYFFKAWDYYRKLLYFGDVPWLSTDLNIDSPELFMPRTPRTEVVDSILWCINYAVNNLQYGGEADGRINKGMANFLKARICLFEGTFRTYHTELNLQGTADRFLDECIAACEDIMANGGYELYNPAGVSNAYWKLFTLKNRPSVDGNKEAILARVYDGVKLGHATPRYYEMNRTRCTIGATKSFVDECLCVDGLPILESPLFRDYDGMWTELESRDPRLTQCIAKPGEYITIYAGVSAPSDTALGQGKMDKDLNGIRYPKLPYDQATSGYGTTVTGYWIIKHWMADLAETEATTNARQTALEFRYAEVLLMLAEAKAVRGTITQSDIDKTINKLRERAGFNFGLHVNSKLTIGSEPADARLDAIYAEKLDYPVSPLLREIRRERRVELFMEGLRYEDLIRWKAGKLMTVPVRGMKFTANKQALYDGKKIKKPVIADAAKLGQDVFVDVDSFIIGYPRSPRITNGVLPWDDKRYYMPIPFQELTLNPNLKQSPGWEGVAR